MRFFLTFIMLSFSKHSTVFLKFALLVKENQILKAQIRQHSRKIHVSPADRHFFTLLLSLYQRHENSLPSSPPTPSSIHGKSFASTGGPIPIAQGQVDLPFPLPSETSSSSSKGTIHSGGTSVPQPRCTLSCSMFQRILFAGSFETADLTTRSPPSLSWKAFLSSHMASLFCCDFFCVDTIFHKRIFVFFIMQTRMIVHFGTTAHPSMAFIRNQLSAFMFDRIDTQVLLIHDNSGELAWFDYSSLSITQVKLPPYSPNLNTFAERFVRSAKSECFNFFIPFSLRHIRSIMKAYVSYYNHRRPHQGISNAFPCGASPSPGPVRKKPLLFGLYTDFFTDAA